MKDEKQDRMKGRIVDFKLVWSILSREKMIG